MDSLKGIDLEFYHSLDKTDREEWLLHRTICDRSLFYFIKEVSGNDSDKAGADISPVIHKRICDFWQDDRIKRKFAYMPRDQRKSTMLTKWGSIWRYLKNNAVRILIPSQKESISTGFLHWMEKKILTNERLRWLYPVLLQVDKRWTKDNRWSRNECELPHEGIFSEPTFRAIGITGAAQAGHYDIINPDDLIGEKGMESPVIMEDAFRWFDNIDELLDQPIITLPNASLVTGTGTHWVVGDLGHYIQEKYPKYMWMISPCLKDNSLQDKENITWVQDPDATQSESNWPEKFPTEYYLEMRSNPEKQMVFWSQHMNNPRESELADFKEEWLKYYKEELTEDGYLAYRYIDQMKEERYVELKDLTVRATIDPAFSDKKLSKRASRTAIVVVGEDGKTGAKLMLAAWAVRTSEHKIWLDKMFQLHDKFHPVQWRIDAHGPQKIVLKIIRDACQIERVHIPMSKLPADVKKDAKKININALTDDFSRGDIYILETMTDFKAEYLSHPVGMTKDILDALGFHKSLWWIKRGNKPKKTESKNFQFFMRNRNPITGG